MVIALVIIFFIVFCALGMIAKSRTGTAPSIENLTKATLGLLFMIGIFLFLIFNFVSFFKY